MTGRTRYGDLLHEASRHILAASVAVERDRFADRATAEQAVTVWCDLLQALSKHGLQLFGSEVMVTGIRVSKGAGTSEVAALRLVDKLAAVGQRSAGEISPAASSATASWTAAAMSVRAASDLLATHRDVDGAWRGPHAQILDDPSVRAIGFAELAALVVPVAQAANHLVVGSGPGGLSRRGVARIVGQAESLANVALEVRRLGIPPHSGSPLRSLGVARPAVRVGDPVVELGDRLARLHRVAWQLTREQYVGIGTLADFAAAGVLVHDQAGRFLSAFPGSDQLMERVIQAGSAWRLVHLHARGLRTAAPPMLGVRGDVLAIRHLHKQVQATVAREQPPRHVRDLESVILGGARSFTDVARWNAEALDRIFYTGQLYLPGRLLSGNEVTNDPALVETKLKNRMITAAKEHIEPLQTAYRGAQHLVSPSTSHSTPAQLEARVYAPEPSTR